ncbi:hypothetical protein GZ77_24620 [Endozoicomonas montiporae]|uniref:Uncharacterized protein n=2 Tax=Endozoicomonas montiporae TaxID=1027273 RepID=A0A081MZS4_9GAMM|nr:hypothetical protein EZMO1_0360 [Endozoicomonas montiporae CL-33]KEQ11697.1 hypothetical protein GZ77_24620 [Endozoicomonas montiporae]
MWLTKRKQASMLSMIDANSRRVLKEITSGVARQNLRTACHELRWRDLNNCNWHYATESSERLALLTKEQLKLVHRIAFENGVTPSSVLSAAIC